MVTGEKAMLNGDPQEDRLRSIHNALEYALTLGDFQEEVSRECTPEAIAGETIKRIKRIIRFDSCAICLVDEKTSDLQICQCMPVDEKAFLEAELAFMIDNGFVAWAIRERRGITLNSKDGQRKVLLHVMATYARIRGLFIGIFPSQMSNLNTASLEIVSIILRNASNGIESLIYSSMLRKQQQDLEDEVERKTRQLLQYEKQLLTAQNMEAIAALAGGVAHQFNNALQVLTGKIDLISMFADGDAKVMTHIERTRPVIERMSSLTSQLLAYARGGTFIANQVMTINTLFTEIVPEIKRAIKATVDLQVDLADESTTVNVDLIQMRTAILAIIANADEAIPEKGLIRISSRLFPWNDLPEEMKNELAPGEYMSIAFEDNGSGMDGDTLRRLFEPFYSTKFQGRGLSMAAVSGIVKRHKGWIHVDSQTGKGTRIQLYLPKSA
ncbi:sensor histidine kinase [Desulfosarcina ovata]|uniref:histidine kinase n=1 Tax=Desulfosarcina ovata subsp. ovata TaxID=2752305 RepID=A0A5K8A619_9BACT|nr:ATP-binding protein [Desulfosarcina ovata]BBO87919.1 hypothetical protein DSCOOX_10990 [Desulfosarcina ovata subsp. ovata]